MSDNPYAPPQSQLDANRAQNELAPEQVSYKKLWEDAAYGSLAGLVFQGVGIWMMLRRNTIEYLPLVFFPFASWLQVHHAKALVRSPELNRWTRRMLLVCMALPLVGPLVGPLLLPLWKRAQSETGE